MNFFARFLVDGAYYLRASARYQRIKGFFYNLLENDNYPYKRYFDFTMMALIFISVFILIREVKTHVNDALLFFNDYVISIVFLIEYLIRVWVHSSNSDIIIRRYEKDLFLSRPFSVYKVLYAIVVKKLEFVRSARAIIDLLAIMPFFHELRLFRLFILFRVFKLFRYTKSFQNFISVLATKKFEFLTLLMFSSIVVFVSAVLIYVMEANNTNSPIDTLFEAFYWAIVTISTVGYGDITPVSDVGRVVAMGVIIAGLMVIAFSTSLVVSAFTEKLDEVRENKTIDDMKKLKSSYLICGYNEMAAEVAKKLIARGRHVMVLDSDEKQVEHAKRDGLYALAYDPASVHSYEKIRVDFDKNIIAVLCLLEDDVQNVFTALTVRSINKEVRILSLLVKEINRKKLLRAGVNEIVYTQELIGMISKEIAGKPVAFEAVHALRSDAQNIVIEEFVFDVRMAKNIATVGQLHSGYNRVVFMGVFAKKENEFLFNPPKTAPLHVGDILVFMGEESFVNEYRLHLHQRRSA
ncbi:MAG TPA: potassium transporter TrkA [Helicobacteraceae bacterium]|nr:potassium transporter TrkA [Helicobacteraceae bacterium]